MKSDLLHWRTMMDELRLSPLYHEATYTPALFDITVVDLPCTSEDFVHRMVASAWRSILETMGFINWWTSSVPGWTVGLDHTIVQEIWDQNLKMLNTVGYLIAPAQDWKHLNFPLLMKQFVLVFYYFGELEHIDK
jgi:hypothetical protein